MKRRILESEEKLLVDDLDDVGSKFNSREDLIYSILQICEEIADCIGINFWGPTQKELESYTDEELEQAFKESESTLKYSIGQMNDIDYSDHEDNKRYFDDLDAKSSEDSEIEDLADLGPEDGEEFHAFAGMGKGRHGRNRIHEVETNEAWSWKKNLGKDKFKIDNRGKVWGDGGDWDDHIDTNEYQDSGPPNAQSDILQPLQPVYEKLKNERCGEKSKKVIKALKKDPNVKNPYAVYQSKKNKGELEENKITIGQLRRIIKEELQQSIKTQELSSEIEDWVKQHRAELEKFYASNPKAAAAVQKAASNQNQHVNENDYDPNDIVAGAKDYYKDLYNKSDVKRAAGGFLFGGIPLTLMLPEPLRNSLFNSIGEFGTIAGASLGALLVGHLLDVSAHATKYADKKKNQKMR